MEREEYGLFRDYFELSSLLRDDVCGQESSISSSSLDRDNEFAGCVSCTTDTQVNEDDVKWSVPNDCWEEEKTGPARPILGSRVNECSLWGLDFKFSPPQEGRNEHASIWGSSGCVSLPEPWKSDHKTQSASSIKSEWSNRGNGFKDAWNTDCGSMDSCHDYSRSPSAEKDVGCTSPKWSQSSNKGSVNGCWDHPSSIERDGSLLQSTGFYGDSSLENNGNCINFLRNATSFKELGRNFDQYASYPQYSNGTCSDGQVPVKQVAVMLNRLLHDDNRNRNSSGMYCAFCKRNKECREFYTTHIVKDRWGKVICPILRKYVCPVCSATGDNAHTLRHCPVRAKIELPSKPGFDYE